MEDLIDDIKCIFGEDVDDRFNVNIESIGYVSLHFILYPHERVVLAHDGNHIILPFFIIIGSDTMINSEAVDYICKHLSTSSEENKIITTLRYA